MMTGLWMCENVYMDVFFTHFCQASTVSSLTLHVDNVFSEVFEFLHGGPEGHDLAAGVLGADWRRWWQHRG